MPPNSTFLRVTLHALKCNDIKKAPVTKGLKVKLQCEQTNKPKQAKASISMTHIGPPPKETFFLDR